MSKLTLEPMQRYNQWLAVALSFIFVAAALLLTLYWSA